MREFPTRVSGVVIIVAIALSWPSAVAAALTKAFVLNGHGAWMAFTIATVISGLVSAGVAWKTWPSARGAPGLWGLYGVLVAFPMCSIWTGLAEAAKPNARIADVAASSVGILFFAAPFAVGLGLLVGGDIAVVLRVVRRVRNRRGLEYGWFAGSVALGLHYAAAIVLIVAYRVWE